jgi:hypothetical protein
VWVVSRWFSGGALDAGSSKRAGKASGVCWEGEAQRIMIIRILEQKSVAERLAKASSGFGHLAREACGGSSLGGQRVVGSLSERNFISRCEMSTLNCPATRESRMPALARECGDDCACKSGIY